MNWILFIFCTSSYCNFSLTPNKKNALWHCGEQHWSAGWESLHINIQVKLNKTRIEVCEAYFDGLFVSYLKLLISFNLFMVCLMVYLYTCSCSYGFLIYGVIAKTWLSGDLFVFGRICNKWIFLECILFLWKQSEIFGKLCTLLRACCLLHSAYC